MAQQKVRVELPKDYGPLERRAIGERIIERIIKRTQSGKDVNGDKFAPYSKSYRESKNFKIAGKSKRVNLTLSEEMLNSIEVLRDRSGSVTVGFLPGDTRNNGKAEGNQKGTYGNSRPVTRPRKFLGISQEELDKILEEFPISEDRGIDAAAQLLAARQLGGELADNIATQQLTREVIEDIAEGAL